MIRKTVNTIRHHVKRKSNAFIEAAKFKKPVAELTAADVKKDRKYIDQFWVNLERYNPNDESSLIGLPNPYLVPAHDSNSTFNFDEMYYWDSYFMVQGFLKDSSKKKLVMGILDNMFVLIKRFSMVPNASRSYLMGRSQPPLLTSFIFDVYEAYSLDKRWLAQAIEYAKTEYSTVWMGTQKPFWHQVESGLSRYYDINSLHDLAEAESGWDMTTRFNRRCLDYLPIDLNALLYKYETDFARTAHILDDYLEQVQWESKAKVRQKNMNKLMWSETKGLFYDYDYLNKKRGSVASLAAFIPLFTGMASAEQAEVLCKKLKQFTYDGGLVTTYETNISTNNGSASKSSKEMPAQWAFPNGWAPLHFMIIKGLENYGYVDEARKIALIWLRANHNWFVNKGVFLEKYNVVEPHLLPIEGVYPTQSGFGWTNAIFERLCQDYLDENKK